MSDVVAEIIKDSADLEALAPEWWDLWRRTPTAMPFQSPAWLLPWWRHFSPGALFTLTARQDNRLVAVAPGYIEDGALGRRILPLGISLSDHLDILADPNCLQPALEAIVVAAASRKDSWDLWELEDLPPGAAALALSLPASWRDDVALQTACPMLVPAAEQTSLFPRGKRRHLNLARNRAARRGPVTIEPADLASIAAALEHLFRLHRLRWESRGGEGVLAPEAVQAFQREAVPGLHAAGLLRIYTLAIGEEVVAAHYELVHNAKSYVYLTGFDPAYDYESPSVILLAHAIEQAVADGITEIDFLRGQEPYKYEWGAVDRWNVKRSIRHAADD
jgi:CelD/BcsL family acetyltransferase involved in cellulose biosynthesis